MFKQNPFIPFFKSQTWGKQMNSTGKHLSHVGAQIVG